VQAYESSAEVEYAEPDLRRQPQVGPNESLYETLPLRGYLSVDGKARSTFYCDAVRDLLRHTSSTFSYSRHTVKIAATDATGNYGVRSSRFTVRR
jgi:hypothetical protein